MPRTLILIFLASAVPTIDNSARESASELENLLRVSRDIFSGGEPRGADAFAALAKLGVKTVISVDSAPPDVEAARANGLRYVHIPIGYQGIDQHERLSLLRLVRDARRPFYIHCHHGRHRGPTAAVVAAMASGEIDNQTALKVLRRAQTSKSYTGLWQAVATYKIPRQIGLLPELVASAEVPSLAASMAQIDRALADLSRFRDAKWRLLDDHPDVNPLQLSVLLKEGLRESQRHLSDDFNSDFAAQLLAAETRAAALEHALMLGDKRSATRRFQAVEQSCITCHEQYRD